MSNMDKVRDLRLMQFTSLLRTYDVVSNARVEQCYDFWLDYESKNRLIDGYTRTDKDVDLNNMNRYVSNLKKELCVGVYRGLK